MARQTDKKPKHEGLQDLDTALAGTNPAQASAKKAFYRGLNNYLYYFLGSSLL